MGNADDFEAIRLQNQSLPDPALKDPTFQTIFQQCRLFTLTSIERMYALHASVQYLVRAAIPGAFVECGVWRGGSCMNMALTLLQHGIRDRPIVLYDTFTGMTPPDAGDIDLLGRAATDLLESPRERDATRCDAALADVRSNLCATAYPMAQIQFVRGDVQDTLPAAAPEQIALLRLDTDWYASTRHELEHLYPRLASGGILIIDDYGHWRGARRATDEYFEHTPAVFMQRIDYSGRLIVKR